MEKLAVWFGANWSTFARLWPVHFACASALIMLSSIVFLVVVKIFTESLTFFEVGREERCRRRYLRRGVRTETRKKEKQTQDRQPTNRWEIRHGRFYSLSVRLESAWVSLVDDGPISAGASQYLITAVGYSDAAEDAY
jgi:hypothetical protein